MTQTIEKPFQTVLDKESLILKVEYLEPLHVKGQIAHIMVGSKKKYETLKRELYGYINNKKILFQVL